MQRHQVGQLPMQPRQWRGCNPMGEWEHTASSLASDKIINDERARIFQDERLNDDAYREDMRHRCITDHFFLADIMGFKDFHPVLHAPVAELYFPKNPKVSIPEQHPIKNRMHLDPRGCYKTTWSRVDSMQWILAFPETITILNESATQDLAKAVSKGIADYFCQYRIPTVLQRLFPELIVNKWPFHSQDTWNTSVHTMRDIDSTLAFTSPQSQQSGWHPWVDKCDDMVDTRNSGLHASSESRRKVIDSHHTNKNTIRRGGYLYLPGTRYHPQDLYGETLANMDPAMWKVLVRGSLITHDGHRLLPGEFPAEDECTMVFAGLPGMDYHTMRDKFHENYESYMAQQMNDPLGGKVPIFTEQMYASCEMDAHRVPPYGGETYTCWRMPCGKKGMEDAAGVVARVLDGKVYALDSFQGNWIPSKLAERMVQAHKGAQADAMLILTTPGSEYMIAHVRNEAARRNVSIRIQMVDWEGHDELRKQEILQLEPLMKVGRLIFSTGMTKAKECRRQFVHFGLVEETGIAECIAKLGNMVPVSQMRAALEEEEIEHQRSRRDDATVNWLLNLQGTPIVDEQAKKRAMAHQQAMQKATTYSWLPKMPGGLDG